MRDNFYLICLDIFQPTRLKMFYVPKLKIRMPDNDTNHRRAAEEHWLLTRSGVGNNAIAALVGLPHTAVVYENQDKNLARGPLES